jgi:hypothetical protein
MPHLRSAALTLTAAAVGGAVGYFAFRWLANMGFYGLVVPGGLLGLAAGIFKNRSIAVAIVCGVAALILGLFAEWSIRPFNADDSFWYLVSHFNHLSTVTLLMIAAGAAIGFWVPFRRTMEKPADQPQGASPRL